MGLAVFGFLAAPAHALDPHRGITQYALRSWNSSNGLPQNSVGAIQQTRDGYLWFGTQEGLARFDGREFTVFNRKNTPEIRRNFIVSLLETRDGSLWASTSGGGLVRYRNRQFRSYTEFDGLSRDYVASMCEDAAGQLWVATRNGLDRLQGERFVQWKPVHGELPRVITAMARAPGGGLFFGSMARGLVWMNQGEVRFLARGQGLTDSVVCALHADARGSLWVGTATGGVCEVRDWKVVRSYGVREGLPSPMINAITSDRQGNLWVATPRGLARLQEGRFSVVSQAQGLPSDNVTALLEDREGSLWVGTNGAGMGRMQDGKFLPLTRFNGLASDVVGAIAEGSDGAMWVGSFNDGVTRILDGRSIVYNQKNGFRADGVLSLCEGDRGAMWLGTLGDGLWKFEGGRFQHFGEKEGLANPGPLAMRRMRNGDLWVGTNGGGIQVLRDGKFVAHYTSEDSAGNGYVRSILEARDGSVWVGFMGGGLAPFRNGKFRHLRLRDGLAADAVMCLYEDSHGVLWSGTMGGGLSRYDGKRFVTIGTQSGLFDDIVYGIVEDRAGRFWMSSNNGIFSVERSQLEDYASGHVGRVSCVSYGEADGMRVHECNSADPAITRTRDGRIWFATLGGVSVLDPASTPLNHSQPPVTLEKVLVDHREIRIQEGIRIQPGRGELEIHYAGLSYVSPEKVQFKYRLEGFDRAWTDAGSRRVAYYTNLPPGRYHFQVTACNNDGVWNEAGTGLGFLLQPHFYQTWWFLTLLGSLVSLLTWLAYRRRLESLHALLEERTRAKEALETTNLRLEEALSDLRRAQSSMIEQERLRALGQMASGITHDFNNCLAPIQGFSEILLKRPQLLDDREKVLGYMETIHTAAKDAGRIVGRLREFYRPRERDEVLPMISLNQVVEQAISLTQPKWKGEAQARGIAIEMHTELPEIPLVPGQDSDLREVLTNLIFNAVDAMPEGGTVSLRTMPEGNQVLLTVGDTGLGMSEEVRRRCLEPFFTTKGECGTGLGLPMVYGILQRHHASVEIQSEPGKGTTFLMRFPVESDRVELASQSLVDGPIRPMRVLVVDDEPTVRTFVTCYLETDKHQVETAVDGMDGLKKLYASEFDLVITDRAMPRMSGDQLAAAVKQARPQTPVIMLTGFGELMSVQGEQPANVDLVLSKPLSIAMLRRAIARLQTPPSTSAEAA